MFEFSSNFPFPSDALADIVVSKLTVAIIQQDFITKSYIGFPQCVEGSRGSKTVPCFLSLGDHGAAQG